MFRITTDTNTNTDSMRPSKHGNDYVPNIHSHIMSMKKVLLRPHFIDGEAGNRSN